MTLLLPVIRDWTREQVVAAIAASDIPRDRCVLILDAPGCEAWIPALDALGFDVTVHATGHDYPPEGRVERRSRWRAMRKLSQTLVPDGPLLCLEDDTLVPPDVWARLSAIGPHVTALQIARHRQRWPVVYPLRSQFGTGVEAIDGCGYGCLLTTGEAYRAAVLGDGPGPADQEHTAQLRPLWIDWECVCGHLTLGGVLWPRG